MSQGQENLKVAEEGIAAINEAYATEDILPWRRQVDKLFDPEVVLEAGTAAFTEGEWRGREGAIGFVANQMEALKGMWMRLDEFIDVSQDSFIVAITFGGRARYSDIPVELHPFHVLTLRDGKILRWQIFLTREAALKAVG